MKPRIVIPFVKLLAVIITTGVVGCAKVDDDTAAYPNRPIKVVVPFSAGGGTDAFARIMKKAIEENDLLPQPLVIINVGGASGTIGSRRVKNARPDGYTTLLLHDAIVMAKYSGKVSYGPRAFEAVAGTSQNGTVVAARDDSPYVDISDAVDQAQREPDSVTFGCNLGTPTHFVGLLLERERPGAAFRFVQTGDGAQRFAALKGGHIELTVFSNEEYLRYQAEGIRALAYFGEQRHPAMPEVPTAMEQGFDATAGIMQYWWMPKGTPADRVAVFGDALEKALATPTVQDWLAEVHSDPDFVEGAALAARLDALETKVAGVDLQKSVEMPNLPALMVSLALLLGGVVMVRAMRSTRNSVATQQTARPHYALALVCCLLTIAYVLMLALQWQGAAIGFRTATLMFVVALGIALARGRWQSAPGIVTLAIVLTFGLHFLFTQVFITDLP